VQEYNLGAGIEVGAAYNPFGVDEATKTAKLLCSKFGLPFCNLSNVWLRAVSLSEMHNDPNVTHLVVASADNQVHKIQEACKSMPLHVSIHPLIDNNCSDRHQGWQPAQFGSIVAINHEYQCKCRINANVVALRNGLPVRDRLNKLRNNGASIGASLANVEIRQKIVNRLRVAPHQCLPLQKHVQSSSMPLSACLIAPP
jgi:hypothetical protein